MLKFIFFIRDWFVIRKRKYQDINGNYIRVNHYYLRPKGSWGYVIEKMLSDKRGIYLFEEDNNGYFLKNTAEGREIIHNKFAFENRGYFFNNYTDKRTSFTKLIPLFKVSDLLDSLRPPVKTD